jgi:hypothetical protein
VKALLCKALIFLGTTDRKRTLRLKALPCKVLIRLVISLAILVLPSGYAPEGLVFKYFRKIVLPQSPSNWRKYRVRATRGSLWLNVLLYNGYRDWT